MSAKPSVPASQVTVVSAGSVLQGDIRVRGALRIEGAVYGNITTEGDMSVGPEGRILGEVRAKNLSLAGRIDGIVHARAHLRLLRGGVLRGHARYLTLEIERGGVMDGSTARSDSQAADEDEYEAAE